MTATGNLGGETSEDIPLTVRQLGDVDGNGAPEPADVELLRAGLNGQAPAEIAERAFDLDANGAAEPTDLMWMIFVLDGRPVP